MQNPQTFECRLYRETGTPVRDRLELVEQPLTGIGSGAAESYWLDVYVPALAPVRRVRLEPFLNDGEWSSYPMEARVLAAIVPPFSLKNTKLPPATEPSDATAHQALREFLCGGKPATAAPALTTRSLQRRNTQQDMALARALEAKWGRAKLLDAIAVTAAAASASAWCEQRRIESPLGPEWYLKVRDFLYREASR